MVELNIEIPERANTVVLMDVLERVCRAHDLTCTLKGTLAKYPDSLYWHYKQGKQKGTLEITWWGSKNRLWFKVANGRTGTWIDEIMPQMKEEILKALRSD